jgi:putative membrane-bound dehydrogenase-like protein
MNNPRPLFTLAWLAAAVALVVFGVDAPPARADDDDLAKELPRIKPLGPGEALKSFQIHKGFRLEPVAVEPLVTDPVSVCYDADGRLYVVEMRGYPYPENTPTGYVRRLEDGDGDGRFDRSTIFLDGLSWPTSVVPYDGGVFIAVAPEVLYAKDNDGDGKADVRKVMFSGFQTQNVQGLFNGLLWGPDGWIYGAGGTNGGEIKNLSRPGAKPVSVRGRDFRFKPDGSAFEAISGGGQFGHGFDDWGHRFTCLNSNNIRQIVLPSWYLERNPALVEPRVADDIAADGPAGPVFRISSAEPWRIVRTRQRVADPVMSKRLPPNELVPVGFFTSATGVTIYRGDAFPPEYLGNAFIGDVGGNLVHRKTLTKKGAEFRADRADQKVEFIASTDNWFRPVNFANTPDGTLLILDMYRETIEHPFSIPEPIKKHLDLTSGKDLGRLYNLVPEGGYRRRRPALSRAGTAELVDALADPSAWWRETAQRLLTERNARDAVPALKEMARSRPTPLGRVHALWMLQVLGGLADDDLIPALKDPDANVREQAAKLCDGHLGAGSALTGPLLALASDPDPMVRFQAAFSIGGIPGKDPRAIDALARIAVSDAGDRWTRAAVLSSVPGRPGALIDRLDETSPGFFAQPEGRPWLEDLAALVGTENDPASVKALLARFSGTETSPSVTRSAVLGLGRGLQRSGGSLREALRGPAGAELAPVFARAAEVARGDGPDAGRVDAIRLLSLGPVDQALATVLDRLDAREPTAVQLAAIQTLADLPDRRVGPLVVGQWKSLSPAVRGEAVEALFARPERLESLLDALESKTLTPSDLDPARRKQLLAHRNASVRTRAESLLGRPEQSDRGAVIAAFRPALAMTGEREKGKEVFRKVCATCHRAEDRGVDVGPNLATVTGRTPEDLLVHVLDPNREVAPNYINYNVATTDGRVLTGLIAEESANAVTLKRAEGASDVVPRGRIEAISSTGLSLMPEGLEKGLAPSDLADLIAYVRGIQAGGQTAAQTR